MRRLAGLPVFWLTLVMIVGGLVVAQLVAIATVFVAPPPRQDFNRLSDMVQVLAGIAPPPTAEEQAAERERVLHIYPQALARPPEMPPGMMTDPGLTKQLADRLGRDPADVRLFFAPDRPPSILPRDGQPVIATHNGEPYFFTPLVAAVRTGTEWRVARTPRPMIAQWQIQRMIWVGAALLVLIPLGWLFARAITRPIRHFAEAADRLGADPHAPPVAEEGPAELRVTARALNSMQARIDTYLGERTAMIGAIAHDLRTPLARIAFRIEGAPDAIRDKVLADVEQMRAMLAATIGFMRSTEVKGERVAVDLAALVRFAVAQEQEVGHQVTLGTCEAATVLGDPIQLERVLQNLVDNGLNYGGAVEVALKASGGQAVLTVADRGPGMPADLLERAFQPFVRGDPSRNPATGGVGLGLTIARTISEDHGGSLVLANRKAGGLEARLALPLAN